MPDLTQQLAEALERLLGDFSRMPDAELREGDPRFAWWYETAPGRDQARAALASFRDDPHRHQQADKQGEGREG